MDSSSGTSARSRPRKPLKKRKREEEDAATCEEVLEPKPKTIKLERSAGGTLKSLLTVNVDRDAEAVCIDTVASKEKELAEKEAQSTLRFLEEHYTCALYVLILPLLRHMFIEYCHGRCYEVM